MSFRKINIPHSTPTPRPLEDEVDDSQEPVEKTAEEPKTPSPVKFEAGKPVLTQSPTPPIKSEEVVADEAWRHDLSLPAEDGLQRDWSRYNRKLAFMYPTVVIPAWRRRR